MCAWEDNSFETIYRRARGGSVERGSPWIQRHLVMMTRKRSPIEFSVNALSTHHVSSCFFSLETSFLFSLIRLI